MNVAPHAGAWIYTTTANRQLPITNNSPINLFFCVNRCNLWLIDFWRFAFRNYYSIEGKTYCLEEKTYRLEEKSYRTEEKTFRLEEITYRLEEITYRLEEKSYRTEEKTFRLTVIRTN